MNDERYDADIDSAYEEDLGAPRGAKPTGHMCARCVPVFRAGPTRWHLWHAEDCPDHPNKPISTASYAKGTRWQR